MDSCQPFCHKKVHGTCSSVEILSEYTVKEGLGTSALAEIIISTIQILKSTQLR